MPALLRYRFTLLLIQTPFLTMFQIYPSPPIFLIIYHTDDPNNTRENNARGLPRARHPMGGSRFPAMEGYAFITLDTTMGEMSDPGSVSPTCILFLIFYLSKLNTKTLV